MSRKVFISFLGTGNYTVVDYQMNDLPPFRTKYIQIASFNYLCSDFNENDKILIFTTPTAKRTNWDDNGHTDRETKEVKPNKGLCTCFRELGVNIDSIEIKEGKQEDEIWDIFQTVFAQLNENDEIIFDITHSFRTIPMLTMVLINYAKFLLNVKIKGIFYGAYDVAGDIKPIWDITAFSELQDWTIAAANYIQFGHAKSLKELSQNEVLPILRSNIHENKTLAQDLFLFAKSLETVSDALATNRGTQIFEARIFKNLNENIEKIKGSNLIPPLTPIIQKIREKTSIFNEYPNALNGFNAVEWCLDHNLIPQGYTMLQESIFTFYCDKLGKDYKLLNDRDFIKEAFHNINFKKMPKNDEMDEAMKVITNEMASIYESLTQDRNDINHGGFTRTNNPENLRSNLKKKFNEVVLLITQHNKI